MRENDFIHIHKGSEIIADTKTFCKIFLHDAKKGAVHFKNRSFSNCPKCLRVADKTEQLLRI